VEKNVNMGENEHIWPNVQGMIDDGRRSG